MLQRVFSTPKPTSEAAVPPEKITLMLWDELELDGLHSLRSLDPQMQPLFESRCLGNDCGQDEICLPKARPQYQEVVSA